MWIRFPSPHFYPIRLAYLSHREPFHFHSTQLEVRLLHVHRALVAGQQLHVHRARVAWQWIDGPLCISADWSDDTLPTYQI